MSDVETPAKTATARPDRSTRRPRSSFRSRIVNLGIAYALVILVALLVIAAHGRGQPAYLRADNVANVLAQTAPFAILVVFETIVLVSGNFDISIASIVALGSLAVIRTSPTLGLWPSIIVAILIGGVIGVLNGVLVEVLGVNSFIVTFGMLTAVRGLVLVITGGDATSAGTDLANQMAALYYRTYTTPNLAITVAVLLLLGAGAGVALWRRARTTGRARVSWHIVATAGIGVVLLVLGFFVDYRLALVQPVWVAAVITVATWLVLRYMTVGRRLYAVGGSVQAARLSGIRVSRYKIGAFVLMGLAAGLVGAIVAAQLTSITPTGFSGAEFTVLTAAVLGGTSLYGGTGDVVKSVVGALFLFTLLNGFSAVNLGAIWQQLVEGVVIIAAVSLYTVASRSRQRRVS